MSLLTRCFISALLLIQVIHAEEIKPDFTLLIPMRDGTELPTDIYLPKEGVQKHPCILMRNPSGKRSWPWIHYAELTQYGYMVAIQDARNVIGTGGSIMPYWSDGWGEQQDGYDTVEWLAKSPFTNGNIGTIGFSAPGITQLLMAPSAPPSLKCQYIGVAASNLYEHCVFNGGQVLKNQVEGWVQTHGDNKDMLAAVLAQREYNAFWDQLNATNMAHKVTAPAIHYGGWYDIFLQGTIEGFQSRQHEGALGAQGKQKLLIGPWTHQWPHSKALGDFTVPTAGALPPYDYSPQRWFDHHLKGIDQNWDAIPAVTYYVMGPFDGSASSGNVWKTSDVWPIPSQSMTLYLGKEEQLAPSVGESGKETFAYDPNDPTPTLGGRNLFLESGPKDQRAIEERSDVLVFTSQPLEQDVEVTGQVLAKIFFETDGKDSDVVVRLTDVYPDGRSILISDGIYRLAYGRCTEASCKAVEEVEVDLATTSIVFAKGHRIRVSVTSSNYPRYEKNLNAEVPLLAHNTVYFGKETPSYLQLPVIIK